MSSAAGIIRTIHNGMIAFLHGVWATAKFLLTLPFAIVDLIWIGVSSPFRDAYDIAINWENMSRKGRIRGYSMVISMTTFIIWMTLFIWGLHVQPKNRIYIHNAGIGITLVGATALLYCLISALSYPSVSWRRLSADENSGRAKYIAWFFRESGAEFAFTVLVTGMLVVMIFMVEQDKNESGWSEAGRVKRS